MQVLILYIVIINAVSFILMLADKYKAKKNRWRIPEATLMGFAAAGGSIGALAGMYLVRHKTKHLKFTVGIPVLLFIHIVFIMWLLVKYTYRPMLNIGRVQFVAQFQQEL